MIGLDFDIPYIDMASYIDMEKFLSLSEEICLGIAKSNLHYPNPGNRAIPDARYPDMLLPFDSEIKWADKLQGLTDSEKRRFLKWYKKVYYSSSGVFIKQHNGYLNKHLDEYSEWTENAKHFPNFIKFIEEDLPFDQTGRIFIFCQDNFAHLTEHRDSMNDEYDNELTDFLWLSIDNNAMRFYIRDNNDEKIYIETNCAWFNENDRHGSDGVPDPTFCIRIDGVFKPGFREKVLQDNSK